MRSSPGNGMSSETVLFDMTVGRDYERFAARLAPTADVYPVFPEYDIELQAKCMTLVRERTDVPAPEVRWLELDEEWLGTQVPRDGAHRRRGAARHPAVRLHGLGGRRDASSSAQRCSGGRSQMLVKLHQVNPDERRSLVPRPPRVRRVAARPAARLPALVLRLGARGRRVPLDLPHLQLAPTTTCPRKGRPS